MKTETEFRKNLAQRLGLVNWKPGTSHVVDHAVGAAMEAGIEFSPEPPVIADEISCGPDGGAFIGRIKNEDGAGVWFRLDRDGSAPFDVRAIGLEVVRRFMLFPELYRTAKAMVEAEGRLVLDARDALADIVERAQQHER